MLAEMESHERAGFVTWTYADLPPSGSLCKRDLCLGLKRLRKAVPRTLRYFACGEYGEDNGRPHYHGIVFGLDWRDRQEVDEAWGLGRTQVGSVTSSSIVYVCDYATKSVLGKGAVEKYDARGLERPFSVCSKGLGAAWCDAHAEQIAVSGVTVDGKECGLPRYFARRLGLTTGGDRWLEAVRQRCEADARAREIAEVHELRAERGEYVDGLASLRASRDQRDRTLQARKALRRKGRL